MSGLKPTWLLVLLSLTVATFAHLDHGLQSLHLNTIERREPDKFNLHRRCSGSCEECFGAGATECPGSTSQCYTPGDSESGIESCSLSGSDFSGTTPSSSPDSPAPSVSSDSSATSGSSNTDIDSCDSVGFDCKKCFGATYIPCPDAPNSYCYDPNDSTSICPDGTSPAGSPDSPSNSESTMDSGSATYTASTSPTTADTDSMMETSAATDTTYTATNVVNGTVSTAETSEATGTSNAGTNVIGSTASLSFTSSRTSSVGGASHTSAPSGNSNGNPINRTSDGQPSVGEGTFGVLAVLVVCFNSFFGLVF